MYLENFKKSFFSSKLLEYSQLQLHKFSDSENWFIFHWWEIVYCCVISREVTKLSSICASCNQTAQLCQPHQQFVDTQPECQYSMVDNMTEGCQVERWLSADDSNFKQFLWHCLYKVHVSTVHNNWLLSKTTNFGGKWYDFDQMNELDFLQGRVTTLFKCGENA